MAEVNNGVAIGGVHVLVRQTGRSRAAYEVIRDLAASLLVDGDVETADWLVSVHGDAPGPLLAQRPFTSKHRAERTRADLVAAAEASGDLSEFDWAAALARV